VSQPADRVSAALLSSSLAPDILTVR